MADFRDDVLPYDKAQSLRQSGALSPEFMNKYYPEPAVTPMVQPVSISAPQAAAPEVPPAAQGALLSDAQPATAQPSTQAAAMTGGIMKDLNNAYDQQAQGVLAGAEAGAKQASQEAAYYQQTQEELKKIAAQNAAAEAADQAATQERFNAADNAINEFSKMKVDPGKFWENKSTGDKVLIGISLALGALGAANGKGNQAVPIIMNAIDQDIKAQETNIATKGQAAREKRGAYQDFLSMTKDRRAAREMTRVAALDQVALKIKENEAKYKDPALKAQAQVVLGQVMEERTKTMASLYENFSKNQALQSSSPVMNRIQALSANAQSRAYDELGKVNEWNNLTTDMTKTYKEAMKFGQEGRIPSAIGGSSEEYGALKAKIAGAVVGKVPGIKSDSDFENIVAPMLPKPGETGATAERKLKNFEGFMKANAPSSPLLDELGMRPKPATESLGSKEGFAK